MDVVSCESCHIPELYAPSRQTVDWTVLTASGSPSYSCRGIEKSGETFGEALISSTIPVLMPRENGDGSTALAPYNLITAWFWVYGDPARPVPLRELEAAWLEDGAYHPDVLDAFDADGDGQLSEAELFIDDERKESIIATRLSAQGLDDPRIQGEVQPYSINHDVTHGGWVTKDCRTCHGETSRVSAPMQLAGRVPGGIMPALAQDANTSWTGELTTDENGALYYNPEPGESGIYIFGHDSVYWIDLLGSLLFLGVLGGVTLHGGLRYLALRRRPPHEPELETVYMYTVYERLWHWLQTAVIFGLIFTGLVIHKPDKFGLFSFSYIVQVHNILAAILVINAALSAFYHLVSGEIQQFLPRPYGFFDQAFAQTKFYLQGIFRGDEHPFVKTPERKMNPLQQVTYFGILNVLLPLQTITGLLMWGVQRWPDIAGMLGGLPFLAPFHTLIAWLFASFIVMHVYLTTTGHTPLAGIRAMIMGWDELEVPASSTAGATD
jgi:thiosulfate reductase cytochrome b subunit